MTPPQKPRSDVEIQVFEKIAKNDASGLKCLFLGQNIKPDICDENGMTPLQHAAYKGNKEIVLMLLEQGADVNSGKHEHGYSALHFAALSGNSEICQLLLLAGAKANVTNSVGRTAAQMAAFVGNHKCVAIINNFISRTEIDSFTIPHGLEKDPKIPPILAAPLHKFVMEVNIHPVHVALAFQRTPLLSDHLEKVQKVLELMRDKEMKRGFETNELMSFKFHYLANIVAEIKKCRQSQLIAQANKADKNISEIKEERKSDPVELFVKKMLKTGRGENGIPEYQEQFLRECVREFPYRESTVFRQMVSSLAQRDAPSALSVITASINGHRGFADNKIFCCTCGEEGAPKKCSKCKAVQYCDRECQRFHWFMHKKACTRVSSTSRDTCSDVSCSEHQLSSEVKQIALT